MDADPRRVEQLAATLRAQADDLSLYAGMLLNVMSGALPAELVEVERESRRPFRRAEPAVTSVTITLDDAVFRLHRAKVGAAPTAEVRRVVRGIVLARESLPLVAWSQRLALALADVAGRDRGAAAALERLLEP